MNAKYLTLQDDYSDLSVEASSDQIEFTIEFGARAPGRILLQTRFFRNFDEPYSAT